jgi:nickel-dependent lactate racemase
VTQPVQASFRCGRGEVVLRLPASAEVFASSFPAPAGPAEGIVLRAVREPLGAPPLREALARRRPGDVAVVVSDVTRPIPYASFLPALLAEIESAGVPRGRILVLVATGMHRPSTAAERVEMFGPDVPARYRVEDHRAEDEAGLADLPGRSASGARVRLDRRFVEAGFRLVTGLVEPHFMAGFSGGRKAVCPGLAGLDTIRQFHGAAFLADPLARNANLKENPLHAEALSVARLAGVDFTANVVLDGVRRVVRAFAGGLEPAHDAACAFVRACACRPVTRPADVVVTSGGGYPLDATFYQCVKGFVSCLPAVRPGGTVVAFGGCAEGIGGPEYAGLLARYAGRWRAFLEDIRQPDAFTRDQWEFQMHARALERVGESGLHFVTDGLPAAALANLSVTGHAAPAGGVGPAVQELLDRALAGDQTVAAFPEGPYCVPV